MVREQTRSCGHIMDECMWQTFSTFDLETFITCVNSNNIFMWKYSTTLQIRFISGFWFCRRLRRLNVNLRWTLVHFRKSHVRADKLDVQETDFSFPQLYRSWNNFSRCRFTHGWNSSSWSLGFGCRSVSFFPKPTEQHQRSSTRKLVAWHHIKQAHPKPNQRSNQGQ